MPPRKRMRIFLVGRSMGRTVAPASVLGKYEKRPGVFADSGFSRRATLDSLPYFLHGGPMPPDQPPPQPVPFSSDQARKQKYWGMGLVGFGACLEFAPDVVPRAPHATLIMMLVPLGMISCAIGLSLFAQAKNQSGVLAAFALIPILGPFLGLFITFIVSLTVKDKSFGLRLNYLSLVLIPIIILVAIAVPSSCTHEPRARQSEAKVGLGGIYTSATAMKDERKTFVISDMNQLGYAPSGTPRYTFWYAVNGVPTRLNRVSSDRALGCDGPPTAIRVAASATGFTAAARGNIDADATCDEWSINDQRVLTNTLNDLAQ